MKRKAFSLVECLVVISILGIIVTVIVWGWSQRPPKKLGNPLPLPVSGWPEGMDYVNAKRCPKYSCQNHHCLGPLKHENAHWCYHEDGAYCFWINDSSMSRRPWSAADYRSPAETYDKSYEGMGQWLPRTEAKIILKKRGIDVQYPVH